MWEVQRQIQDSNRDYLLPNLDEAEDCVSQKALAM